MESTIIENEMLDELADELRLRAEIATITARHARRAHFEGAIRERVAMLANLRKKRSSVRRRKIRIMPGAPELVATMKAYGAAVPSCRAGSISIRDVFANGWVLIRIRRIASKSRRSTCGFVIRTNPRAECQEGRAGAPRRRARYPH